MIKLLIADDEKEASNVIRHMIPWSEYDITLCTEAANGREAIDIIHKEQPDIALLDVRMPLIDGLGVIKYIYEQRLSIQVIILSGYDEFVYAQTAIKYGVSDYLLKPCRMEDILNSVLKCKDDIAKHKHQNYLLQGIQQPFFSDHKTDTGGKSPSETTENAVFLSLDLPKKKLLEAIRTGKTDLAAQLLEKLFAVFAENSCTKNGIINYLLFLMMDIAKLCTECSIPLSSEMYVLMDFKHLACFSSLEILKSAAEKAVIDITEKIDKKSGKSIPVYAAIRYIEEHYQENLDLNRLSEQVHVTPAYLSLLFKMQMGINFLEFLTNYRIEKACELLKTTSLKNYEIAYQTGFKDEKYFSTVFKKQMGMPPSKYRRIHS